MNKEYEIKDDHIGIFKNYFPEDLIDKYLNYFKHCEKQGIVLPRKDRHSHEIEDSSTSLFTGNFFIGTDYINKPFVDIVFKDVYPLYLRKYSFLSKNYGFHTIYDAKIQKTNSGQGYHIWHAESAFVEKRNRILAFSLFLNNVENGGELEFLYQKHRFKPVRNTFLLWPSGFTHLHRGNPPLSGSKYIITGWIEYGLQ
jgi:hypothetical protein